MKYIILFITCLTLGSFASLNEPIIFFSLDVQAQQQSSQEQKQSIPNELIKSYSALSLNNNKPVTIANTSGEVILLNSWATWCLPCREEMPGLEKLHLEFQSKGLDIIGISVDSQVLII